jgi:hypothetical protein
MSWAIDDLKVVEMPGEGLRITLAYKFDGAPVFHGKPRELHLANGQMLLLDDVIRTVWAAGPPVKSWESAILHGADDGTLTVVVLAVPPDPNPGPRYVGIG